MERKHRRGDFDGFPSEAFTQHGRVAKRTDEEGADLDALFEQDAPQREIFRMVGDFGRA